MTPEVRVSSWTDLMEQLFANSWREDLARFRSSRAFRGSSSLATGLARLRRRPSEVEAHLLRAFQKYASEVRVTDGTQWGWLALAQHYGLPTRLLDWSYSPLVALHFATANVNTCEEDATIWYIDYRRSNEYLPRKFRQALTNAGSDVFTTGMLAALTPTLDALDAMEGPALLFLEPPSLDARIVNQFALFSLLSGPDASLEDWIAAHDGIAGRVVVPAALRWEVRDKLDQANINERVLFPGLDGLSRWLARYYSQRRVPS
jgi:FRG domain